MKNFFAAQRSSRPTFANAPDIDVFVPLAFPVDGIEFHVGPGEPVARAGPSAGASPGPAAKELPMAEL